MADEKLAMEALDKLTGGSSSKFIEGIKSLSTAKKIALAGAIVGTLGLTYEAGRGFRDIKKLVHKEEPWYIYRQGQDGRKNWRTFYVIQVEPGTPGALTLSELNKQLVRDKVVDHHGPDITVQVQYTKEVIDKLGDVFTISTTPKPNYD